MVAAAASTGLKGFSPLLEQAANLNPLPEPLANCSKHAQNHPTLNPTHRHQGDHEGEPSKRVQND